MIGWFIVWLFYRSNYIINCNTFIASAILFFLNFLSCISRIILI